VHGYDRISLLLGAVPRTVQGDQRGTLIGRWYLATAQERNAKGRAVGSKLVDRCNAIVDPWLFSFAKIGVGDLLAIGVRPTIKPFRLNAVQLARREIVSQEVAPYVCTV
jgi:hypothetical protein